MNNALNIIFSIARYSIQLLALLLIAAIVLVVNLFYYTEQPLNIERNYFFPIALTIFTFEFLLNLTKDWKLFFRLIAIFIFIFQVQQMIALENQLSRKKFLHENYVIDFSYDNYCNLSSEDKLLLEEMSIYGYTDCDDAKIPYRKVTPKL